MPGGKRVQREVNLYQGKLDGQEIRPELVPLRGHLQDYVVQRRPNNAGFSLVHVRDADALLETIVNQAPPPKPKPAPAPVTVPKPKQAAPALSLIHI